MVKFKCLQAAAPLRTPTVTQTAQLLAHWFCFSFAEIGEKLLIGKLTSRAFGDLFYCPLTTSLGSNIVCKTEN